MGMFDNYEALNKKYQPNNLSSAYPKPNPIENKLTPAQLKKPYEQYNEKGELIGYFWYYGDTLNLEFNLTGEVVLDSSVTVYYVKGQEPTSETAGDIIPYQDLPHYIYNIADNKWFVCKSKEINPITQQETYIWEETSEPEDLSGGTKNVYFDINDILQDKRAKINIYDFRNKLIMSQEYDSISSQIVFPITQDISLEMQRGTYQCSLILFNKDTNYTNTLFSQYDCVLTVK